MKLDILKFADGDTVYDTNRMQEIKGYLAESVKNIKAQFDVIIEKLTAIRDYNFGPEVKAGIDEAIKVIKDEKESFLDKFNKWIEFLGRVADKLISSESKFAQELGEWVATFSAIGTSLESGYTGTAAPDTKTAINNISDSALNISQSTRNIAVETANIISNIGAAIKGVTHTSIQEFVQKGGSILTQLVSKIGTSGVFSFLGGKK